MGTFGGFSFDSEVFAEYMSEQPTWSNAIIASKIMQSDATIMDKIGEKGNVATLPFYRPLSIDDYAPKNNDGATNNVPATVSGGKQTCVLAQRMSAWKALDFTKELTGADPIAHVANSVANYYQQVWEKELMTIANAVMGVSALASHVTDITSSTSTIADANKFDETTLIYAQQKALGDMANGFGLVILNSAVFARLQALKLVNYDKYTITNAGEKEVNLPTINGLIPVVSDRYTFDTTGSVPVYKTLIIGEGAFLTAEKTNYEKPYYTDYDAETTGGVEKLYTKQGRVLHPNGLSFAVANMATDSPTNAELATSANWSLAFNAKNVKIGQILSNG